MNNYWELKRELLNPENNNLVNAYLQSMKRKNRKKQTITRHRGILHRFFLTCDESFDSISWADIQRWLTEQNQGRNERTVQDYLHTFRAFYNFCISEKYINMSPIPDSVNNVSSPDKYWELKKLLPNQDNQTIINQFLLCLKNEGRMKSTIECKRAFLQNFFAEHDKSYADITLEDINNWLSINQNTWHERTLELTYSALRCFYEFCYEQGIMHNPPLRRKRKATPDTEAYWEVQVRLPNEENKRVVNEFLLNLKNRHRSKKTVEEYRIFLQSFFKYNEVPFSIIKTKDIDRWFTKHRGKIQETSIENYLGILRSFYHFCVKKKYVEQSPIVYKWEKDRNKNYWKISKPFLNEENKEVINEYLLSMKLANMSKATISQYKFFLEKFFKDRNEIYSALQTKDFLEWLNQHHGRLKEVTIKTRLRILSSFYQFCVEESYMEKNLIKRRWYPRSPKPVPKYLEKSQKAKVIQQSEKEELRERVIVEFLLSSGSRVGEIHTLNRADVDLENRTALVRGKGKKIREVHFSEKCALLLERYMESTEDEDHLALFISERGTRLSIRRIQEIVEHIGEMAGIESSLHPHRFRHTFATELLSKGADISFIADELGHKNLQTTQIYANLPKANLIKLYRMYMG
ncbi:site-specific tyrosine recombinase/integron integrase [Ureibacillus composti]